VTLGVYCDLNTTFRFKGYVLCAVGYYIQ